MAQGAANGIEGDVEDLGRDQRYARHAERSAELARRADRSQEPWPGTEYASFGGGDFSGALTERAELYDFMRDQRIDGFVIVSGDRHSFWAGYAAKALPPAKVRAGRRRFHHRFDLRARTGRSARARLKDHPLRPLFVVERPGGKYENTINLTLKHGVKSALEYAQVGRSRTAAHQVSNPDNAPHLEFVDMGGHGYAVVTAGPQAIESEFVCIPRPIARATTPDGGPLRYRVRHCAKLWKKGEKPALVQQVVEGNADLSV